MKWFKKQGYEVHYASMGEEPVKHCDKHHKICFNRSPFSLDNVKAYKPLKKIIDTENYDIIHCHTPMGGVVTRLAARSARKNGTKVIYTAHGFHFYNGAPKQNWAIYYTVEKLLARITDVLITINTEDYHRALNKMNVKEVIKINGVGVNLNRFKPVNNQQDKSILRKKYGYDPKDIILICVAELNGNKNQEFLIRCIKELIKIYPTVKLLLCGEGGYKDKYIDLINELHLKNSIILMGYRKDVNKLMQLSDIGVAASIREGLGLSLIEELATGLPIIASTNRGHNDIITSNDIGFLYITNDTHDFISNFNNLIQSNYHQYASLRRDYIKKFSINRVLNTLKPTYTLEPPKDHTNKEAMPNVSLDLGPQTYFFSKLKGSKGSLRRIRRIVDEETANKDGER